MSNRDEAQDWTEERLKRLEKRIEEVYREAMEARDKSVDAFFAWFEKADEKKRKLLEEEKITEKQYQQWRLEQLMTGNQYKAMRDKLAERMTHANEIAIAYVNDETPGIYSINRNWTAYKIEQAVGNCDFTLYDERVIKRLIVENPGLMPNYPEEKAIKRDIDLEYGKKQITSSITSGILQGRPIDEIAQDLMIRISGMNKNSAIRAARTATTGAQNAGRLDGYNAAAERGIKLKKQWLATLDGRTRHSHAALDGATVDRDKKFDNGCMYPGDPNGRPEEIYNCRCTMIAVLDDEPYENAQRRARSEATGKNYIISDMTYEEWEKWKTEKVAKPVKSDIIKEKVKTVKYKQFDTGDAANDFFYYDGDDRGLLAKKRSKQNQWEKSLSEDENCAIGDYTGGGYYDINSYLRKTGDWKNVNVERVENQIKALDSAIGRYELKDNIRVQRGVMNDVVDRLAEKYDVQNSLEELVGMKYVESGYSSTTVLQGNGVATAKPTVFDIEIPAGMGRGAYVNRLAGQFQNTEYEFLIKRGASFTIKEVIEEEVMGEYHYRVRLVMDVE
nr:MAG TPA: minor capsid protein [Caudoviricetes sp.]